jgi:hypothetical protein
MADRFSAIPHDRFGIERIGGQSASSGRFSGIPIIGSAWSVPAANPSPPGGPFKAMGPQLATLKVLTLKAG